MHKSLEGKVALISGGAGAIGLATARLMTQAGTRVVVADLLDYRPDSMSQLEAEYVRLDVSSESAWEGVVKWVDETYGGVDILVNAAGIEGNQEHNTIASTTLADWKRVHSINLDGTFLGCQKVMPVMERKSTGSIVNVSSVASYFPMPFNCAYGSSKAAVQHLTKSVAAWGTRNGNRIRCNSVHPGLIRSRMLFNIVSQRLPSAAGDAEAAAEALAASAAPLGTLAEPEDIASQIMYLASDEAGQVTGSEFRIDGGWSLVVGGWHTRLGAEALPEDTSAPT